MWCCIKILSLLCAFHFHFSLEKEKIFSCAFYSEIHIFLFILSSSASSSYFEMFFTYKYFCKCLGGGWRKILSRKENIYIFIINKIQIADHYMNNCGIFSLHELLFIGILSDTKMILLSAKKSYRRTWVHS